MARVVVGNPFEGQIPTVSATAQPVDTYVQGVARRNPFDSLATTLKNFSAKAKPVLRDIETRRANEEYAEGLRLYNETRKSVGEAVKLGAISESDSPYLRKGYRVGHLNVLASRYTSDLDRDLEAKKLFHAGDPAKISAYVDEYYAQFTKDNPLDGFIEKEVADNFSSHVLKANEAFRTSWLEKHRVYADGKIYDGISDQINASTVAIFENAETDREIITANFRMKEWLENSIKGWEADGLNRTKLNKLVVDSIVMSATENENTDILDLLNEVKLGTGSAGSTAYARNEIEKAEEAISTDIASRETARAKAELALQKKELAIVEADGNQAVIEYFNGGLKEEDAQKFNDAMGRLRGLADLGNNEAAGLMASMYKFWDSQLKDYNARSLDQAKLSSSELREVYGRMENINNAQAMYDILAEETDSSGKKLHPSQMTALLAYGNDILRRDRTAKLDFQDSTSAVRIGLKRVLGLTAKPVFDVNSPKYLEYDDFLADLEQHSRDMFKLESTWKAKYFEAYKQIKIANGTEPNAFEKDAIVEAMLAVVEAKFSVQMPDFTKKKVD